MTARTEAELIAGALERLEDGHIRFATRDGAVTYVDGKPLAALIRKAADKDRCHICQGHRNQLFPGGYGYKVMRNIQHDADCALLALCRVIVGHPGGRGEDSAIVSSGRPGSKSA